MNNQLAYFGGKKTKNTDFFPWPYSDEAERKNILDVLDTGHWWRMTGDKVAEFEKQFAKKHGATYALGVTNGTHALELALSTLGIGEGDEVIVPAITFISTVTAVIYNNATPVIVDVDPHTFCMDVDEFENAITPKTKAVIPVHIAGHACRMDEICRIAKANNIKVLEDAAHGHGGMYKDKSLGSCGDMSIFSFQNGKIMTSGEGGAIITSDPALYERAWLIHGAGRPYGDINYEHKVLGSNYRMSEFQGAILLAQLQRLDEMNRKRDDSCNALLQLLKDIPGIIPQERADYATVMTHYMFMFYYDSTQFNGLSRALFIEFLKAEGIPCFVSFPVLSETEFFQHHANGTRPFQYRNQSQLVHAKRIAREVVWIPHYTLLGDLQDLQAIADAIRKIQSYVNSTPHSQWEHLSH